MDVERPHLLVVHLERAHACLLFVVPELDDAVDGGGDDLQPSVEPADLDQGLLVALQGAEAGAAEQIPNLERLVA